MAAVGTAVAVGRVGTAAAVVGRDCNHEALAVGDMHAAEVTEGTVENAVEDTLAIEEHLEEMESAETCDWP